MLISVIKTRINKTLFQIGKLWFTPVKSFHSSYDIVFIFLSYDLSGAPRVHLDIVSVFRDKRILVIFLKESKNKTLLKEFISISGVYIIKNKNFKSFYLGRISSYLVRKSPSYIFGMGIPDFYSVIQNIDERKVKIIDINHAIITLNNLPEKLTNKLYRRIVIDEATKKYLIERYKLKGYSEDQICLISNKTNIPDYPVRPEKTKLSIIFVGRDTYEKRAHLVPCIAKELGNKIDFDLKIIGKFNNALKYKEDTNITFIGEISEKSILNQYYKDADIILLVSSREGFPMVLMEAMSYGLVPVCTPAGGIAYHIESGVNGFLINGMEESEIIESATNIILSLFNNREQLIRVSLNAYKYAKENFGEEKFVDAYKELIRV